MFLLNGNPLATDTPFTDALGNQYPANWLRLATAEEKAAIGITESDDPVAYDDRFYWGVNNPKDLEQLKAQWVSQVDDTVWKLLNPTDYMDSRKANDASYTPPADWLTWRASVRVMAKSAKAAITSAVTVEDLIPLTTIQWPIDPTQANKV